MVVTTDLHVYHVADDDGLGLTVEQVKRRRKKGNNVSLRISRCDSIRSALQQQNQHVTRHLPTNQPTDLLCRTQPACRLTRGCAPLWLLVLQGGLLQAPPTDTRGPAVGRHSRGRGGRQRPQRVLL